MEQKLTKEEWLKTHGYKRSEDCEYKVWHKYKDNQDYSFYLRIDLRKRGGGYSIVNNFYFVEDDILMINEEFMQEINKYFQEVKNDYETMLKETL